MCSWMCDGEHKGVVQLTVIIGDLILLHIFCREGKYWFKSGCPTPDPRWPAVQQLMVNLDHIFYIVILNWF